MKLLDKCRNFTEATVARQQGWYPYFKVVESEQGPEAVVDGGKKCSCSGRTTTWD